MNIFVDSFSAHGFGPEENENAATPKKNRGGRPQQISNLDAVLNRRNRLIQTLSYAWGDIGWKLITARTCEDLRAAFRSAEGFSPANEHFLRLFVRDTASAATAPEIRATQKEKERLVIAIYKLSDLRKPLTDKLQRSFDALRQKTDNENLDTLLDEHFQRMESFQKIARDLEKVETELKELEIKLEEQEAFYVQTELLGFIHDAKYAHNPRNLAQAMAALPEVGCWYSFQQCEKTPSPLWPMEPEEIPPLFYRIFQLIEECCDRRNKEPDKKLVDIVRNRVRAIPPFSDLRFYLRPDWRYVRRAVEETNLTDAPSRAAPYRIFSAFIRKRAEPRTPEENTFAEREASEI